IGTAILLVILVGAAVLSASTHLRRTSIILITAGFLLLVSTAGWISLGHSEEKGGGLTALPASLQVPKNNTFAVTAAPGGALKFAPTEIKATTGLAKFDVEIAGAGHTFGFHETDTLFG